MQNGAETVAVVTGAGRGLGRAVCVHLARQGYHVIAVGHAAADLTQTAADLETEGSYTMMPSELVTSAWLDELDEAVRAVGRPVRLLVHCASATADPDAEATLEQASPERIDETFAVTLGATGHLLSRTLRHLRAGAPAHAIVIASDWALQGSHGPPVFSAAKAGVLQLARTSRREFARAGVGLTCIVPGDIATYDEDWQNAKWTVDDGAERVRAGRETRILIGDVTDVIDMVTTRRLCRIDEVYLSPLDPDYEY